MNRIRVAVVDDHTLFRAGLISLLKEMEEFQVVGEAEDGYTALEMVRQSRPDVLLLDVNMPAMNGVEVVRRLREQPAGASLHILMLTISKNEDDLLGAIAAGADGYLLKSAEPEELRRAILLVAQGLSVLSPQVTRPVLRAAVEGEIRRAHEYGLSARELEVLRCLARGSTTAQIAAELFISENTVKTHVRHILEKLEVTNRNEAVQRAIHLGLIASVEND